MNKLEEYFKGDELAASVWKGKYAIEGEETPDDMHKRMAIEFGRIEEDYNKKEVNKEQFNSLSKFGQYLHEQKLGNLQIFTYFKDFRYIVPQGSIMAILGNKTKIGSLSNCFVIGQPSDSYGGIMQKDQELVQLMKRRGGVGIDISTLRPASTFVSNAAGSSTGAVSFMHRFSNSTREVAQNGRRGALMLTIDCRHPDLLDFINIKKDLTQVTGANISVRLRDDFMQAVEKNEDYILRFPCDMEIDRYAELLDKINYNVLTLYNHDYFVKKIKAKEYFDKLVENNWISAEPGLMFVDKHWDYSPDGVYPEYRGITTNPCGEIFMQEYDACRLMALNLFSIVDNPFTKKAILNLEKLYEIAYIQQRLADDLVDLEIEHIDRILAKIETDNETDDIKAVEKNLWLKISEVASAGRRTGCGFTALGDMLAALNIKYDSKEAKKVIKAICKKKMEAELDCTIDLAILRGTFKGWDIDKEYPNVEYKEKDKVYYKIGNDFYEMLLNEFPEQSVKMQHYGRRNISWSTVAPTGSVSILTQTTSGLEPLFSPYYFRNKKVNKEDENMRIDFTDKNGDNWQEYAVLHPKFKDWLLNRGNDPDKLVGSIEVKKKFFEIQFEESPWYKSCANDIDWLQRVEIQAIIQRYTTHSISSTINLPEDVNREVINEIYMTAWESRLKGITIYRDKCRSGVLTNESNKKSDSFIYHDAPKRPQDLPCDIFTTVAKGKRWNVIVGLYDRLPYEVFAIPHFTNENSMILRKLSKGRYDLLTKDLEVYSEDISSEMTDEENALTRMISTALRHGSNIEFIVQQLDKSHGTIISFSKAISRILSKYSKNISNLKEKCPECKQETLIKQESCTSCVSCGYSKC